MSWKFESIPYTSTVTEWLGRIRDLPYAFALQSGDIESQRFDLVSAAPTTVIVTRGGTTTVTNGDTTTVSTEDPFATVEREVSRRRPQSDFPYDLPFSGGAVGFFGYELAHRVERLVEPVPDVLDFPDMVVGIYDWFITIDHDERSASLVATPSVSEIDFERIKSTLGGSPVVPKTFEVLSAVRNRSSRASYRDAVERIKRYIDEGDCYQVNLTQRFEADVAGDSLALFDAVLREHAAPYAAYLSMPEGEVLSFSPERFLKINDGHVTTQPIKGTRPRGRTAADDDALADELSRSEKDRAENLMIVDLLRNDLGRCCVPGSITVSRLFELQSFPNVHHLVSTIEGLLQPGKTAMDLFRAAFPGGSITGAPKVRAMQIIRELEPVRRSAYCGAIGYYGYNGSLDSNLAIRTMVVADSCAYYWGGGGIVADSVEDDEYQESLAKVSFIRNILERHSVQFAVEASEAAPSKKSLSSE